jgi:phosphoglycerate dehydrogenase-like enzyme
MPLAAPFYELDNVIITPHVSGWTEGMLEARTNVIAPKHLAPLQGADEEGWAGR